MIYGKISDQHEIHYRDVLLVFEKKLPQVSERGKTILTWITSKVEDDLSFWRNPNQYPASICIKAIAANTGLSIEQTETEMAGLKSQGLVTGEDPFWGILCYETLTKKIHNNRRQCIRPMIRRAVLAVGKCLRCGRTERLSIDHIIPVTLGGSDELSNLQCLCLYCNCSKGNRYIG
jgi:hypothetical protein